MARQPIFDRRSRVVAYELLYRSAAPMPVGPLDERTSAQALVNALAEIGLERLAGSHPAYFNVSPGLLHDPALRLLPAHRVVLEILEDTPATPENIDAIGRLRSAGYSVALDDFTFAPNQMEFIPHVDLIKVDVLATPWSRVIAGIPNLKTRVPRLLAEKVEDRPMFRKCREAGFHYFQGYFFAKPETMESRALPPSRVALLRVLSEVHKPNARAEDVERAVACDAGLALRLLRLVNSAAMALPRRIDSIRTAVSLLGARRIQALAVLLAASARSDSPPSLGSIALNRARACEAVARKMGCDDLAVHFTVGLLSVLDAMLDVPMSIVVEHLPLTDEVSAALLDPHGTSPAALALHAVLRHEEGDWENLVGSGVDVQMLTEIYSDVVGGLGPGAYDIAA